MPNKTLESFSITRHDPTQDGRRKLTDQDRTHILELHAAGLAIREIARRFSAIYSRRLIMFVIYPERYEALKQWKKQTKPWRKTYDKEKHRLAIAKTRAKKKAMLEEIKNCANQQG